MNEFDMLALDLAHNWHPCSQMKDYETFKPLLIKQAYGSYIELTNKKKIIDAISSWWCKSLGHQHPRLKKALKQQIEKFEHVIFANTTYPSIIQLSQKLSNLMPGLTKVFYAGDGSSAVEIALKMSIHSRLLSGETKKTKFVSLKNAYHGETSGAMSVSDLGLYRKPYQPLLFDTILIEPAYVHSSQDPVWDDASDAWAKCENILNPIHDTITAIIVEPIVQGAAGMQIYSKDFLYKLACFAKNKNIHLIADEIMTGIGRTGKMLATEYADIVPDFLCIGKGLTAGWLAFSAVLTNNAIYQYFYDDYEKGTAFLHSHTYSGNALGVSLALAALSVFEEENLSERANYLQTKMRTYFEAIAEETGLFKNIRGIGGIIAADLHLSGNKSSVRAGYHLYKTAIECGALLRPLGNTCYWMPPLNIREKTLASLYQITLQALKLAF